MIKKTFTKYLYVLLSLSLIANGALFALYTDANNKVKQLTAEKEAYLNTIIDNTNTDKNNSNEISNSASSKDTVNNPINNLLNIDSDISTIVENDDVSDFQGIVVGNSFLDSTEEDIIETPEKNYLSNEISNNSIINSSTDTNNEMTSDNETSEKDEHTEIPKEDESIDIPNLEVPDEDKSTETPEQEVPKEDESTEVPEPEIPKEDESTEVPEPEVPKEDESTETPEPEIPKEDESTETPEPEVPKEDESTTPDIGETFEGLIYKLRATGYGNNTIGGENTVTDVFEVWTKAELAAALSCKVVDPDTGVLSDTAPRIIVLMADINMCIDSAGNEYTPGVTSVSEILSNGIWSNSTDMIKDVVLKVPSNTTILGKYDNDTGSGHTISGGGLKVIGSDNVAIRYVNFEDAYDFFPEWDGSEWNTEIDNLVIDSSTNVWIDHCSFSDGPNSEVSTSCTDIDNPIHHDGLLDIKKGSDYITISNTVFEDHLKAILIGHSDSYTSDAGTMHVTFCYNYFNNIKERMPRVRYGNIHSFNNYYTCSSYKTIGYVFGLGKSSTVYSEDNIFEYGKGSIYKAMSTTDTTYYYQECGSIENGEIVEAATYGADTPPYTSAVPPYQYTTIDVTLDNYESVKAYIISNAGHSN